MHVTQLSPLLLGGYAESSLASLSCMLIYNIIPYTSPSEEIPEQALNHYAKNPHPLCQKGNDHWCIFPVIEYACISHLRLEIIHACITHNELDEISLCNYNINDIMPAVATFQGSLLILTKGLHAERKIISSYN